MNVIFRGNDIGTMTTPVAAAASVPSSFTYRLDEGEITWLGIERDDLQWKWFLEELLLTNTPTLHL